jgi:hypothetical protein
MRLQTGDRVVDLDDERHEGRVEGVRQGYFVAVRWDNGWHSTVPLDRLRRISTRNILHRANKNPDL